MTTYISVRPSGTILRGGLIIILGVALGFAALGSQARAGLSQDNDWSACTVQYDCHAASALDHRADCNVFVNAQGFVSSPYTSPWIKVVGEADAACDFIWNSPTYWNRSTFDQGLNNVSKTLSAPHPANCDYLATSYMESSYDFVSEGVDFYHELDETHTCGLWPCP